MVQEFENGPDDKITFSKLKEFNRKKLRAVHKNKSFTSQKSRQKESRLKPKELKYMLRKCRNKRQKPGNSFFTEYIKVYYENQSLLVTRGWILDSS